MKKNIMSLLLVMTVFVFGLTGCSRNKQEDLKEDNNEVVATEGIRGEEPGTESIVNTEASVSQLGNAVEIPEGWKGEMAETDAHEQLEKVIAEYCNASEENYADVRYFYNYVNLNGDDKNEILALVLGPEVADGNMLLWIDDAESGNMTKDSVKQVFEQVGTPVYISNHMTEGYRDLILVDNVNFNGSTEIAAGPTYKMLIWTGDKYQSLEEGMALENLDDYEGTAVITNDIESDFSNNLYHFLGEAMKK